MYQPPGLWGWIKSLLFYALPHHLISRITFRWARLGPPFKDGFIRLYLSLFKIDMSEAQETDPYAYPTFNDFFVRALKPEARPIAGDQRDIVSPVDGTVLQLGRIDDGRIVQAKGRTYSIVELLGGAMSRAAPFADGEFCTLYLSPRDYHRVHMPADGRLREMVHVPGRLFSVAPYATHIVPRLFARNERMAAIFDADFGETRCGPMAVVLIGAINVAAIETAWAGLVTPPKGERIRTFDYPADENSVRFNRGEEIGRFNMGSTVIVLFPPERIRWADGIEIGRQVKMGEYLATAIAVQERQRVSAV